VEVTLKEVVHVVVLTSIRSVWKKCGVWKYRFFVVFFLFSFLPSSRVLYVVYVSVENYVLCTRLK